MARSTQVTKMTRKRKAKYQPYARKQARIDKLGGEKFSLSRGMKVSGVKDTTIIERSSYYGTISQTDGTVGAIEFELTNLPNYTDFINLYEQYRIIGVKVTFVNNAPTGSTYFNTLTNLEVQRQPGTLITCIDLDDIGTPTVSKVLEHESAIIHGNAAKTTRELVPAIATSAYQGAFTGYASRQNQWLLTSSPSVQQFGLKYAVVNNTTASSNQVWQVFLTYIVEFKLPY